MGCSSLMTRSSNFAMRTVPGLRVSFVTVGAAEASVITAATTTPSHGQSDDLQRACMRLEMLRDSAAEGQLEILQAAANGRNLAPVPERGIYSAAGRLWD